MSDYSMFSTRASSGGPSEYLMKTDGGGTEIVPITQDMEGEPELGWHGKLQLKGISTPFERQSTYPDRDGNLPMQTLSRFLFRVADKEADDSDVLFSSVHDFRKISKNSVAGQVIGAIRNRPIAPGESMDKDVFAEVLDGYFGAVITNEGKDGQQVTPRVLMGSAKPVKAKAAKTAKAAPTINPFDADDDEDSDAA